MGSSSRTNSREGTDFILKTILLTGGGTAGHVMPNLALVPRLRDAGWQVEYVGSYTGMERQLVESEGIPYHGVATGKLRRYRDLENLKDPFRVIRGVAQSYALIGRLKPTVVFSKGGFVGLPLAVAARLRRVPVILHEADLTLGLANRLALPFATKVAVTFAETAASLPKGKAVHTGLPIRREVFSGNGRHLAASYGFTHQRPVLLVTGGSSGAKALNEAIWSNLPGLLEHFQVVHLCGRNKMNPDIGNVQGYVQIEYAQGEMPDLLAMSQVVMSRAGSNTIFELLALKKPHLLIPLPASQSRGDQIQNAKLFAAHGYSAMVEEEHLPSVDLCDTLVQLYEGRESYVRSMESAPAADGVAEVMKLITSYGGD